MWDPTLAVPLAGPEQPLTWARTRPVAAVPYPPDERNDDLMATFVASTFLAISSIFNVSPADPVLPPTVKQVIDANPGFSLINFARRKHRKHKRRPPEPYNTAMASYYSLGGSGACGTPVQSGFRFASLIMRCGTVIDICHASCRQAVMSDHGPYVSGRTFDLNVNLKQAIGCPDLCIVRWRYHR